METWQELAQQLLWEMNPQDNSHGTPYTFNKFDDSKWLTGQGAMTHGPGHYSADLFDVANGYNPNRFSFHNKTTGKSFSLPENVTLTRPRWALEKAQAVNMPRKFSVPAEDVVDWFVNYKKTWNPWILDPNEVGMWNTSPATITADKSLMDVYKYADDYDLITTKAGNTYKVNVPNENFMWKEGLPLESQSKYVQKSIANRKPVDYTKYLSKYPEYTGHLLGKIDYLTNDKLDRLKKIVWDKTRYAGDYLNNKHLDLASRLINKLPIDEQLSFLRYLKDGDTNTVPDMLKLFGPDIKGIRARGSVDGPINVTFSGKNIRMANTPLQRITNRIPVQTLGKIANKIGSYPAVQLGGAILNKTAVPLMVYDMLSAPVSSGTLPYEGDYNTIRQRFTPLTAPQNPLLQGGIEYNDYR